MVFIIILTNVPTATMYIKGYDVLCTLSIEASWISVILLYSYAR